MFPIDPSWIRLFGDSARQILEYCSDMPADKPALRTCKVPIGQDVLFKYAWTFGNGWYTAPERELDYPPLDTVKGWWETFPAGLLILLDPKGILIGYASIWPIKQISYDEFVLKRLRKLPDQIMKTDILPSTAQHPTKWWYLADIIVSEPYLSSSELQRVRVHFILKFLGYLIDAPWFPNDAAVLSFPVTHEGRNLLASSGFRPIVGESVLTAPLQTPCCGHITRQGLVARHTAMTKKLNLWRKWQFSRIVKKLAERGADGN